ncbi:MAG: hypothetical protein ACI9YU_000550 [Flavobacteriales bacterium]|jgi:hypothetical protein
MTAYLDNNIFIYIENQTLSTADLLKNVSLDIKDFFYSASHLQEANEMTADNDFELSARLKTRFSTISEVTRNNYLYQELATKKVHKLIERPSVVFDTINEVKSTQSAMKQMVNTLSEKQKEEFRKHLNVDSARLNNYNPKEVIEHINQKSGLLDGYSFLGLIERAIEIHPQGKQMSLHNRVAGVFEILDMMGYWKDKFTSKSNYARLWDGSHTYFSSFCDYFISDDRNTRNKAKVAFEIYGVDTKVISSKGIE